MDLIDLLKIIPLQNVEEKVFDVNNRHLNNINIKIILFNKFIENYPHRYRENNNNIFADPFAFSADKK